MSQKNEGQLSGSGRDIVVSRVFDAPRELLWKAMTDPGHVVHWWGPRGFSLTIGEMTVAPGGVWNHVLHGPDGTEYPNRSVFSEVVEPERIVLSQFGGRKGGPQVTFVSTWTFEDLGNGRTRLTLRSVFPTADERDNMERAYKAVEGGRQTLERLAEHLPTMAARSPGRR